MTRFARAWLLVVIATAILAPLLANDAPIVASIGGELRFPAFASYAGRADVGPDLGSATTWREWWAALPVDSEDWAVFPPCPYGPLAEANPELMSQSPNAAHPFGTDSLGRDLLARMIWGAKTAMWIGAGAVALALLIGIPLGALAGYRGGLVDSLISMLIELFLCFPALFFVLTVAAFVGDSGTAVIAVLGLVYWTSIARIVRGVFLSMRERDFVLAARGLGVSTPSLLFRHMLPCIKGPVLVNAAFLFAAAIVVEATLAFLGLGAGGDSESWGTLLAESKEPGLRGIWHLWLFPALVLVATVWSLHTLADRPANRERAVPGTVRT